MPDRRSLIAKVLAHPRVRALGRLGQRPGLVVLTYHRVCEPDDLDENLRSCSPAQFREQLTWLRQNMRIVGGPEIEAYATGKLTLTEPSVCVTFDDGYRDNLPAARVMRELGVPGIFFMTTGFVGTRNMAPWDRLAWAVKQAPSDRSYEIGAALEVPAWTLPAGSAAQRLKVASRATRGLPIPVREAVVARVEEAVGKSALEHRGELPVYMPWSEVRELASLGHAVGAHTCSHAMLPRLSPEERLREMRASRDQIAQELGRPCTLFAYPFGKSPALDAGTIESARAAGFTASFSFYGGYNGARVTDPHDIRRVGVAPGQSHALFVARNTFPALLARSD